PAVAVDRAQDRLLALGPESPDLTDAAGARRRRQLVDVVDAQRPVQRERAILADARQLTQLENGGGQRGPKALEDGAAARRGDLRDHGGERATDPWDLGQRARFETPLQLGVGERLDRVRATLVRPGAKGIVAREAKARADLAQRRDDPAAISGSDRAAPSRRGRPPPCRRPWDPARGPVRSPSPPDHRR